jgi:hypothetical protein
MWQKIKDQFPAILATAILIAAVVGGYAYYVHARVIPDMQAAQQRELTALKDQHAAELRASAEETRRQIEAVNTLLKDAIQRRAADAFLSDEEMAKMNAEKVDQLAEAIATKIQPFNPLPKTPEEAERIQNEQVDKVSGRLAERIQPILAQMATDQNLTRDSINAYSQRISDQVSVVLTTELAKNQQLNNNLQATQSVAQESVALSHELTALYLASLKDQGAITRLLSLPANVIRDVSKLSLIESSDKKKKEEELVRRMNEIQSRLQDLQKQNPAR